MLIRSQDKRRLYILENLISITITQGTVNAFKDEIGRLIRNGGKE